MIIRIDQLKIRALIGVHEWERTIRQDVGLTLEVEFDGSQVSHDRIATTIDYEELAGRVVAAVEQSSYYLVESLARQVANLIMQDPRIRRTTVEVSKLHALEKADRVTVIHTVRRGEDSD